jgi:hypothetical protein
LAKPLAMIPGGQFHTFQIETILAAFSKKPF